MKAKSRSAWIIAAALLAIAASGLAQHGPKQRPAADRPGPVQQEQRASDQDRMQEQRKAEQQARQEAQDQARATERAQQSDRDIYGYQMMTEQERNEYRRRLEDAKTTKEREQIMTEHRAEMQARAKDKGVDLEETEESE